MFFTGVLSPQFLLWVPSQICFYQSFLIPVPYLTPYLWFLSRVHSLIYDSFPNSLSRVHFWSTFSRMRMWLVWPIFWSNCETKKLNLAHGPLNSTIRGTACKTSWVPVLVQFVQVVIFSWPNCY